MFYGGAATVQGVAALFFCSIRGSVFKVSIGFILLKKNGYEVCEAEKKDGPSTYPSPCWRP
jgi:hypothetical protein